MRKLFFLVLTLAASILLIGLASADYLATSADRVSGTDSGGNFTTTFTVNNLGMNTTAAIATPGIDVRYNFTSVNNFSGIKVRMRSVSILGASYSIGIFNYQTNSWQNLTTFNEDTSFFNITNVINSSNPFVSGGLTQVRIQDSALGFALEKIEVDYITLLTTINGCLTISNPGVYLQGDNIGPFPTSGPCILINSSDVTFDGNGYRIFNQTWNPVGNQYPTRSAIQATNLSNITLQNLNLSINILADVASHNIVFDGVNDSIIQNSIIYGDDGSADSLSRAGIYSIGGRNLLIQNNSITDNSAGIEIFDSNQYRILNNFIGASTTSVYWSGLNNSVFINNTVNFTFVGSDLQGQVGKNNTIQSNTFLGGNTPFAAVFTSDVNDVIRDNLINKSYVYGIYLDVSAGNHLVLNNTIINSDTTGSSIYLRANNTLVLNNTLINNTGPSGIGIDIYTQNNTVTGNSIRGSNYGIVLNIGAAKNFVANNNILDSVLGGFVLYQTIFNNTISNIVINHSLNDAVIFGGDISGMSYGNNTLNNLTVSNTVSPFNDFAYYPSDPSLIPNNGTIIIDTNFGRYDLGPVGGQFAFIKTGVGRIDFLSPINGSGTNLSFDINLRNNFAFVNSSQKGLNVSANVTFLNMPGGFLNPRIMKDNLIPCNVTSMPSCNNFTSLNVATVLFNVSSWSNYSIMAGPTTTSVQAWANNSRANISIMNGTTIWLNATNLVNGTGNFSLILDGNTINIGNSSSSLSNLTQFNNSGTFNVTAYYAGSSDFLPSFETWFVTVVNQAGPNSTSIQAWVSGQRANINIVQGTIIYLNATNLVNGTGNIQLILNGTVINTGASPLSNLTQFNSTGTFNVTAFYPGNTNFLPSFETWFVTVTAPASSSSGGGGGPPGITFVNITTSIPPANGAATGAYCSANYALKLPEYVKPKGFLAWILSLFRRVMLQLNLLINYLSCLISPNYVKLVAWILWALLLIALVGRKLYKEWKQSSIRRQLNL